MVKSQSGKILRGQEALPLHPTLTSRSVLLMIADVKSGLCVGHSFARALIVYFKCPEKDLMTRLLNITTNNGSGATAAVKYFFPLANSFLGIEQFAKANHILCMDQSIQLAVVMLKSQIKQKSKALREALVRILRSKVRRQEHRRENTKAEFSSNDPPHHDCPIRWSSSHKICFDCSSKSTVPHSIMDQYEDDLGCLFCRWRMAVHQ